MASALLLLALGAGCSSDGPSLDDYVASAAEVCEDVQREADALALPTAGPSFGTSLVAAAELSRDEVEALLELPEPSERRAEVEAWHEALGRRVTALETYAAAVEAAPPDSVPPVPDDLATATTDAAELADQLGLDACGAGVDTPIGTAPPVGPAPDDGSAPPPTEVPTGPLPGEPLPDGVELSPDATTTEDK